MPSAVRTAPPSPLDWTQALRAPAALSPRQTRTMVAAMAALHLGGGWALLQVPAVREAVMNAAPVMVELLAAPAPPQLAPPPPPAVQVPPPHVQPVLAAPSPAPAPAEVFSVPPPPPTQPVAAAVAVAPAVTPAPPAPAAPAPAAPKRLDATAVSYVVPPPVEVPLASRRAGESGVVWLRVIVDTRGLPALVQVQRSSGHPRLDEQATWALRQAHFKPHTQNGTAIEVEVIAPIEYLLE